MKLTKALLLVLIAVFTFASCNFFPKKGGDSSTTAKADESGDISYNDTFKVHFNYYADGKSVKEKIEIKQVKKDGKEVWIKDGRQWVYYQNGKLQAEFNYVNGKREGVAHQYYGDGKTPYIDWSYKNSKKDGITIKYYQSGRVMAEMPYKSDFLGTGSQDYADDQEHTKLTMPELKVWADDQRRYKGKYTVYAKVEDKFGKVVPKVKFTVGQLIPADGRLYENPNLKEIAAKNNVASVTYYEINGFPPSVTVNARFSSSKGTPVLLSKTIKID
ncbi:toxin-antitoxin system YwqK family antitoxin [Saccharicrinis sp. FJH62]|uniref:toxin-antitoxin system YwqK family antitoxin n=1 Tax=Saccharicrinis sp. FJH62 TaxID=3344657 RepID=UPI0035D4414C